MTVASPFLSDKPSNKGRFHLCWILARALILALIVGCVVAYGVRVRLLEWPMLAQSGAQILDVWLAPSDTAALVTTAVETNVFAVSPLMARGAEWIHEMTGWSLASLGFWLPVVLGPLVVLPPVLLLWAWGYSAGALATGMFIGSVPIFLATTRLGFCGVAQFNVFFALLLASLLAAWLTRTRPYALSRWFVGEELHPVYDPLASVAPGALYEYSSGKWDTARRTALWRVDTPLFVLVAFGIGLVALAWTMVYPAGKTLVIAMLGAGILASLWLQRRRLVFALLAQALMVGVIVQPQYAAWALLAVLVATQIPPMRAWCAQVSPKVLWVLCLILGGAGAWLWWPVINGHMHRLMGLAQGAVPTQAAPLSLEQLRELWVLFVVHPYWLYIALGGMAIGLCLRPALLVFCPLVIFGLAMPWLGPDFALYGAAFGVMFGMGIAFVEGTGEQDWTTLSVQQKIWWGTRKVTAWGATLVACWLLFTSANTVTVVNWEGFERLHSLTRAARLSVEDYELEGNAVRFDERDPLPFEGLDVLAKNGSVSHTPLHAGNGQYAVWNALTKVVYVLPKALYDASYVRLLLWDKTQALVPAHFVLMYDALPRMRVFKRLID